jgi:hypothetical protein
MGRDCRVPATISEGWVWPWLIVPVKRGGQMDTYGRATTFSHPVGCSLGEAPGKVVLREPEVGFEEERLLLV